MLSRSKKALQPLLLLLDSVGVLYTIHTFSFLLFPWVCQQSMACYHLPHLSNTHHQTKQQHLNSISTTVLLLPTAKNTQESSGPFNFPALRSLTQTLAASVPNGFPPRSSHPIFSHRSHLFLATPDVSDHYQSADAKYRSTDQPRQQGQRRHHHITC